MNAERLCFFCEVKGVVGDDWLGQELTDAGPDQIVGGSRPDPAFNRLSEDIHTAAKQFDAVNAARAHPNVLAFVNYDPTCGVQDVLAVLTGKFYTDGDRADPIYTRYSEGRVRLEKLRIDMYLWIEARDGHHFLYTTAHEEHFHRLAGLFGSDPNRMQRLDA